MQRGVALPREGGVRSAVSWAPCPVPSRGLGVLGCVDGQRAQGTVSVHVTRHGTNVCWGPELCVAPPQIACSPSGGDHVCAAPSTEGAPGLAGMGMVNDAKGSSGLGRPSLLCPQGRCARHFTFPFSTSSLGPDATREQLGKGPWTPASRSRLPGWFSPATGPSFLAWGWGSAQVLQGGAA